MVESLALKCNGLSYRYRDEGASHRVSTQPSSVDHQESPSKVQEKFKKAQARIRKSSGKVQLTTRKAQARFRKSSVNHQETSRKVILSSINQNELSFEVQCSIQLSSLQIEWNCHWTYVSGWLGEEKYFIGTNMEKPPVKNARECIPPSKVIVIH